MYTIYASCLQDEATGSVLILWGLDRLGVNYLVYIRSMTRISVGGLVARKTTGLKGTW